MIGSGAAEPEMHEARLNPHARNEHGRQCCGGRSGCCSSRCRCGRSSRCSASVTSATSWPASCPGCRSRLHLVDSRPEQLDRVRLADVIDGTADVGIHHTLLGEQVLEQLPRGAHVLIMTHDHAEDYALCDAALRLPQPLGSDRADRLGGQVDAVPAAAGRRRARPGGDRPDHQPDRPARDHRQGPGRDRGRGRRRAAGRLGRPGSPVDGGRLRDPLRRDRRRHARRPVHRGPGGRAGRRTAALLVRDGVILARGSFAAAARRAPAASRSPTCAAGCCCPASSTPTSTSRRSGRSAGSACRCSTGSSGARCPRRASWPTRPTPARWPGSSSTAWWHAGTTTALVFGSHFAPAVDVLFTAAGRRGPEHHRRPGASATGCCAPDLLHSPETALADSADLIERWHDRGRLRYAVTPRFSLSTSDEMLDACAAAARQGRLVHLAHQREPGRGRDRRRAVPRGAALPGHLPPARPGHRRAACSRTTCTPATPSSRCWPSTALGRALPDQQLRAGQRAVPAAPARASTGSGSRSAPTWARAPGFSCPRRALQAYFMQQLLGARPGCR